VPTRRTGTAVLLLVAVGVVLGAVSAADTASIHTTPSDFQAGSNTNMTITGTGTQGAIELARGRGGTHDIVNDEGDGSTEASFNFVGDTASDEAQKTEIEFTPSTSGAITNLTVNKATTFGSDYGFVVDIYLVRGQTNQQTGEGTLVRSGWDPSFTSGTETIDLDTNVTVAAGETYTLEFVTQSTDNDGSKDNLYLEYDDSASSTHVALLDGGWQTFDYYGDVVMGLDPSEPATASYTSANHSVSDATSARVNITTAANVSVDVIAEYWTGSAWQTGNSTTVGSSGVYELSLPSTSSTTWRIRTNVTSQSGTSDYILQADSIAFDSIAPTATNFSPPDNTQLTSSDTTFSVAVNDSDFSTAQGDSVTATLYIDGNQQYTTTVSQNTTVATTETLTTGGDHSYYWTFNDSYGNSVTSATRTVTVPNTLYIYNESEPHSLLDGANITIEVTATGSAGSVKKTTVTDGKVNLTGLPADESYVFTLEADEYFTREVYIEDLYEQSSVFLLNKSAVTSVENKISVADRTGRYTDNPAVIVQRVINTSTVAEMQENGDQWVTIGGDRLGASGFYIANLQQGERYRFLVRNQNGATRVLGEYTAKSDGPIALEIGEISYSLGGTSGYKWTATAKNKSGGPAVTFAYRDTSNITEYLNVSIRYRSNGTLIASKNFSGGPYGEVTFTQPIPSATFNNQSFVVSWTATRNGTVLNGSRVVGGTRNLEPPVGVTEMQVLYGGGVFVLAFVVGAAAGAPVAGVTVALFGGIAVFLGLAPPALGFGAIILALFLSIGGLMMQER
jgi:hypothetical protein